MDNLQAALFVCPGMDVALDGAGAPWNGYLVLQITNIYLEIGLPHCVAKVVASGSSLVLGEGQG